MKPYAQLKRELKYRGIDTPYLAQKLGLKPTAAYDRLSGRTQWRLWEMYKVLDLINMPPDRLHELFDPDSCAYKKGA